MFHNFRIKIKVDLHGKSLCLPGYRPAAGSNIILSSHHLDGRSVGRSVGRSIGRSVGRSIGRSDPPPPADRRPGQVFSSRPMSPLRCTVAFEIFSKSCDGNPIENFFIGEGKFLPTRRPADCFLAPMSSLRYIVALETFSKSHRISPVSRGVVP